MGGRKNKKKNKTQHPASRYALFFTKGVLNEQLSNATHTGILSQRKTLFLMVFDKHLALNMVLTVI